MGHEARFPDIVDSTMLVTFQDCPQKFWREYCQRYALSATSPDLHAGGALAAGLDEFRKSFYDKSSPFHGNEIASTTRGFAAFMNFWGLYDPPPGHNKSFVNTAAAFLDYFREYSPATDDIQPYLNADGVPATEFTFSIPLPVSHPETGNPILYAGRFDMLGMYGGKPYVVDEKTTKAFQSNWVDQWEMRSQFLGYTWACRQHDIPTEGAIVRGIAIQKTQIKHLQAIKPYTDTLVQRWYNQMVRSVQHMVQLWKQGYWDYNFGNSCTMYWGCPFLTICPREDPDQWLIGFEERTWNPLHRDPTDTRDKLVEHTEAA